MPTNIWGLHTFTAANAKRPSTNCFSTWLLSPKSRLDPALYPPNLVRFFNIIIARNKDIINPPTRTVQAKRPVTPTQIVPIRIERRIVRTNPMIAVLPFGVPQFANGQTLKASLLLAGEAAALGLNIVSYAVILSMQNTNELSPQRGRFEDAQTARNLQITQYVSLGVFAALLIYGWVDGFFFTRKERVSVLPDLPGVDPRQFKGGSLLLPRTSQVLFSNQKTP